MKEEDREKMDLELLAKAKEKGYDITFDKEKDFDMIFESAKLAEERGDYEIAYVLHHKAFYDYWDPRFPGAGGELGTVRYIGKSKNPDFIEVARRRVEEMREDFDKRSKVSRAHCRDMIPWYIALKDYETALERAKKNDITQFISCLISGTIPATLDEKGEISRGGIMDEVPSKVLEDVVEMLEQDRLEIIKIHEGFTADWRADYQEWGPRLRKYLDERYLENGE